MSVRIEIKLGTDLANDLDKAAAANGRSRKNFVEFLCLLAIANYKTKRKNVLKVGRMAKIKYVKPSHLNPRKK